MEDTDHGHEEEMFEMERVCDKAKDAADQDNREEDGVNEINPRARTRIREET
jgi:hypothetical protein